MDTTPTTTEVPEVIVPEETHEEGDLSAVILEEWDFEEVLIDGICGVY